MPSKFITEESTVGSRSEPQCRSCQHLIEVPGGSHQCAVMRDRRIPEAIWLNVIDHSTDHVESDNGYLYERATDDEMAMRAGLWAEWRRNNGL